MHLQEFWFLVFGALIAGYAILDGFDLGVGCLHLFSKGDLERRQMLNSIGPVWDGNEVWLVTGGGALFAGFPAAYACICSAFYIPVMALLFGLIFRACAIEFRSKHPSPTWRNTWDVLFSAASFGVSFCLGYILGHLIKGIPLDSHHEVILDQMDWFHPYPYVVGLTTIVLFSMHGALYVILKNENSLFERAKSWVMPAVTSFVAMYIVTTILTLIYMDHMSETIRNQPYFLIFVVLAVLFIANIPRSIHKGNYGWAFISSAASILSLVFLYAMGTFPNLVRNTLDPANSLSIYNGSSSELSLTYLAWIVFIGMPFVLGYTFVVHWIFRGKVTIDSHSY